MNADTVYGIVFFIGGFILLAFWVALMERWKNSGAEPLIDPEALRRGIVERADRLSGWHRLGVLLSVIWTLWCGVDFVIAWQRLPQPDDARVSSQSAFGESLRRKLPSLASMRRRNTRNRLVRDAAIHWALPIAALYATGYGAAWVRRGFRPD